MHILCSNSNTPNYFCSAPDSYMSSCIYMHSRTLACVCRLLQRENDQSSKPKKGRRNKRRGKKRHGMGVQAELAAALARRRG